MRPTAISLSHVGKRFGTIQALQDVSLDVSEGEFVSLIGPSGCGKTTLLRLVAGLELASQGEVCIFGTSPSQASKMHEIGMAFQRPALLPFRTALDNIKLTLEITGDTKSLDPKQLLDDFEIGGFARHYPHQLSGGMQQRVNIAASMVHDPKILLLDEPFGALDELTRESLGEWLSRILVSTPKTVVFVTHSVDEAVVLSDRIVILSPRPGKVHKEFCVPFSKPRKRNLRANLDFLSLVAQVRSSLYQVVNGE
jgi:NitT/TauT family transport system ATP-binding protein